MMNSAKVVIHKIQRDIMLQIFQLLGISDGGVLDYNGLILDSTNAACLNYIVSESDGNTNLEQDL
jgi:hypothetical protein